MTNTNQAPISRSYDPDYDEIDAIHREMRVALLMNHLASLERMLVLAQTGEFPEFPSASAIEEEIKDVQTQVASVG